MTARRKAHAGQGELVCDAMGTVVDAGNIGDVFALWVDRIAELNLAIEIDRVARAGETPMV